MKLRTRPMGDYETHVRRGNKGLCVHAIMCIENTSIK
jgi:hypothetical protein